MSTRANIVLQEKGHTLWLYHHSDGYPSYLGWKLMQIMEKHKKDDGFEITKGQHGDIEYLYLIDIQDKEIACLRPDESLLKRVKYNSDKDIQEWYNFCK